MIAWPSPETEHGRSQGRCTSRVSGSERRNSRHFRYELWSSASNELGSRALAAIARRRIGTHGVANGLNDPTPGPPSAADSDTSTNADNVPKYAALRRSPWAACKIAG